MKFLNTKILYWSLIIAFTTLYVFIGFVSTLHSIEFFHLANNQFMSILLGTAYEVSQVAILFALLTTNNKHKLMPWLLMILITSLQISANVYASYKYMLMNSGNDWIYWKDSLLFWLDASDEKTYKIVIAWIQGALLPIVALGLTSLVADNLKLKDEQDDNKKEKYIDEGDPISDPVNEPVSEKQIEKEFVKTTQRIKDDYEQKEYDDTEIIKDENKEILESEVSNISKLDPNDFISSNTDLTLNLKEDIKEEEIKNENINQNNNSLDNIIDKPIKDEIETSDVVYQLYNSLDDEMMPLDFNIDSNEEINDDESDIQSVPSDEIIDIEQNKNIKLNSEEKIIENKKYNKKEDKKEKIKKPIKKENKPKKPIKKEVVNNLEEIKKPSKGDELIKEINEGKIKIPDNKEHKGETTERDGVEVVDVKLVNKNKKVNDKLETDRFGIPINPKERKSFDKI